MSETMELSFPPDASPEEVKAIIGCGIDHLLAGCTDINAYLSDDSYFPESLDGEVEGEQHVHTVTFNANHITSNHDDPGHSDRNETADDEVKKDENSPASLKKVAAVSTNVPGNQTVPTTVYLDCPKCDRAAIRDMHPSGTCVALRGNDSK